MMIKMKGAQMFLELLLNDKFHYHRNHRNRGSLRLYGVDARNKDGSCLANF